MNKKNLIGFLVLAILVLAIPLGLNLIRQQQTLKSSATEAPITFSGDNTEQRNGAWVVKDRTKPITVTFTSPLGPPGVGVGSTGPHILQSVESPAKKKVGFSFPSLVKEVYAGTRQCKATFTPSELGINDCSVCNRLHEYRLQDTCEQNNTCSSNADCPQNRDQPNFIEPATSNWCYGFADGARCLQLRYTGTGSEPSCGPGDQPRDPTCDRGGGGGGGGGTVGECTVSWQLSNENPAPGSTIQVKVRGVSDPKGWQNIELYLDESTRDFGWGGIENPWPTFVYNRVQAGSAGPHTLKFTTDKNTRACSPQQPFTTGTAPSPTPVASTTKECDFNGNNEYDDGDIVNFWKDIFLGRPGDQTRADCNRDGSIDLLDFNKWRNLRWHGSIGN